MIGISTVGALLQNRLASSLMHEATVRSAALPSADRQPFISAFRAAADAGLQPGARAGVAMPRGTPAWLAAELERLAAGTFAHGYVLAMRWTMVLPITMVTLAAVSCLAIRRVHAVTGGGSAPTAATPRLDSTNR